ncbi:MAG: universal stress protein [Geminicoccaceae bacterium]|nr:universal stress protein [Geminicoccaceae bacterium]
MYSRIMVPVDLQHVERLEKALASAADLAKHYRAEICYVGVTASVAGPVAHDPEEYGRKLEQFGRAEARKRGVEGTTRAYTSHDPAADLDKVLMRAIEETRSDLVVMASHLPGLAEHIFASNAGYLASHAAVSVFVVR